MDLRAGFGSFFRGWGGISVMLRPPQSHAAPKTHSGQLRLLQHHSPKSQFLPIPGTLPCLPGRVCSSSEPDGGGSSTAFPQICCKRGRGGCKIAPSEVPPAQSFSRELKQGAGLGGYLTQRNSFKGSKFKARAIESVSLRQPRSSGQQGSQNLEEKRWEAPPRRPAAKFCPSLCGF